MGKVAGIFMIVLGILQGTWIGYKVLIENTTEFPNLILPISLIIIVVGLIKWDKDPHLQ